MAALIKLSADDRVSSAVDCMRRPISLAYTTDPCCSTITKFNRGKARALTAMNLHGQLVIYQKHMVLFADAIL